MIQVPYAFEPKGNLIHIMTVFEWKLIWIIQVLIWMLRDANTNIDRIYQIFHQIIMNTEIHN